MTIKLTTELLSFAGTRGSGICIDLIDNENEDSLTIAANRLRRLADQLDTEAKKP